jgi:hypothetical protein
MDASPLQIDALLAEAVASDAFSNREKALLKALAPIAVVAAMPGTMSHLQAIFGNLPSGDSLRDHMEYALRVFLRVTTPKEHQ